MIEKKQIDNKNKNKKNILDSKKSKVKNNLKDLDILNDNIKEKKRKENINHSIEKFFNIDEIKILDDYNLIEKKYLKFKNKYNSVSNKIQNRTKKFFSENKYGIKLVKKKNQIVKYVSKKRDFVFKKIFNFSYDRFEKRYKKMDDLCFNIKSNKHISLIDLNFFAFFQNDRLFDAVYFFNFLKSSFEILLFCIFLYFQFFSIFLLLKIFISGIIFHFLFTDDVKLTICKVFFKNFLGIDSNILDKANNLDNILKVLSCHKNIEGLEKNRFLDFLTLTDQQRTSLHPFEQISRLKTASEEKGTVGFDMIDMFIENLYVNTSRDDIYFSLGNYLYDSLLHKKNNILRFAKNNFLRNIYIRYLLGKSNFYSFSYRYKVRFIEALLKISKNIIKNFSNYNSEIKIYWAIFKELNFFDKILFPIFFFKKDFEKLNISNLISLSSSDENTFRNKLLKSSEMLSDIDILGTNINSTKNHVKNFTSELLYFLNIQFISNSLYDNSYAIYNTKTPLDIGRKWKMLQKKNQLLLEDNLLFSKAQDELIIRLELIKNLGVNINNIFINMSKGFNSFIRTYNSVITQKVEEHQFLQNVDIMEKQYSNKEMDIPNEKLLLPFSIDPISNLFIGNRLLYAKDFLSMYEICSKDIDYNKNLDSNLDNYSFTPESILDTKVLKKEMLDSNLLSKKLNKDIINNNNNTFYSINANKSIDCIRDDWMFKNNIINYADKDQALRFRNIEFIKMNTKKYESFQEHINIDNDGLNLLLDNLPAELDNSIIRSRISGQENNYLSKMRIFGEDGFTYLAERFNLPLFRSTRQIKKLGFESRMDFNKLFSKTNNQYLSINRAKFDIFDNNIFFYQNGLGKKRVTKSHDLPNFFDSSLSLNDDRNFSPSINKSFFSSILSPKAVLPPKAKKSIENNKKIDDYRAKILDVIGNIINWQNTFENSNITNKTQIIKIFEDIKEKIIQKRKNALGIFKHHEAIRYYKNNFITINLSPTYTLRFFVGDNRHNFKKLEFFIQNLINIVSVFSDNFSFSNIFNSKSSDLSSFESLSMISPIINLFSNMKKLKNIAIVDQAFALLQFLDKILVPSNVIDVNSNIHNYNIDSFIKYFKYLNIFDKKILSIINKKLMNYGVISEKIDSVVLYDIINNFSYNHGYLHYNLKYLKSNIKDYLDLPNFSFREETNLFYLTFKNGLVKEYKNFKNAFDYINEYVEKILLEKMRNLKISKYKKFQLNEKIAIKVGIIPKVTFKIFFIDIMRLCFESIIRPMIKSSYDILDNEMFVSDGDYSSYSFNEITSNFFANIINYFLPSYDNSINTYFNI